MGAFDDIEAQESESVFDRSLEMKRLIREEVRAAMREQNLATNSSEPAPPSYDSSASLLATDSAEPHDNDIDTTETPSKEKPASKSRQLKWIARLPTSIQLLIIVAPLLAVFISLPIVSSKGSDPLLLSRAAFFQLIGATFIAILLFIPVVIFIDSNENNDPPESSNGFLLAAFLTYNFLFTYLFLILILWWWFVSGEGSMLSKLQAAEKFDAKFDDHDALARMAECLYNNLPGRNATIKDVETCLMKLGLPLIS